MTNKLKDAKKALVPEMKVGDDTYKFDVPLFDLSHFNIVELNEQMADIPAHFAWVGTALSKAETELDRKKVAFEMWRADKMVGYSDLKTEKAKENQLLADFPAEMGKLRGELAKAESNVRILKIYKEALSHKVSLAQTIAANNRAEREAFERKQSL